MPGGSARQGTGTNVFMMGTLQRGQRGPDVEDSLRPLSARKQLEGSSSSSSSSGEEPEIFVVTRSGTGLQEDSISRFATWVEDKLGFNLTMLGLRVATLVWVITGITAVTHWGDESEQRDTITALYLLVQIITTVGYGDVTPTSQGMKLFMAFYVLIGNVLTALVITERLQKLISRSHTILKNNMVNTMVEGVQTMQGKQDGSTSARGTVGSHMPGISGAVRAFLIYLGFILIGALYYGLVDNCLCRDAGDCNTSFNCEDNGGRFRTIYEGFYMAVITLTTVGFGDELPLSNWGRLFGIFWMLFGVASMANFLAELAHMILQRNMQSVADHGLSHELFLKIDQDGSGSLTKFEFITYMLVKYGLISECDLDTLIWEFQKFDKDGSGELTYEEIQGHGHDGHPAASPASPAA